MKRNKLLFVIAFAMIVMLPLSVNAETDKEYTVVSKNLEDYVCEELKGHELSISLVEYNRFTVYDEDTDKEYWIDLLNLGVCKEYKEEFDEDDYVPTEYSWDGSKLYLAKYTTNSKFVNTLTLDEDIEPNNSYATLEDDEFYHVSNPTKENLSTYYEGYYFQLSTDEYNGEETYFEIKTYSRKDGDSYELATKVELVENSYEVNKYYVLAKPEKELINEFTSEDFLIPKTKSGLETDITLTKYDFFNHFEYNNKKYFVFYNLVEGNRYFAIFDGNGNYQTFGLDSMLVIDKIIIEDKENMSILVESNDKYYILILNKNLEQIVKHEVDTDEIYLVGKKENTLYYLDPITNKFLEINYLEKTNIEEPPKMEENEEIPNTFDGIGSSIFMGTISLIGLVGVIIYLKKRNKIRA